MFRASYNAAAKLCVRQPQWVHALQEMLLSTGFSPCPCLCLQPSLCLVSHPTRTWILTRRTYFLASYWISALPWTAGCHPITITDLLPLSSSGFMGQHTCLCLAVMLISQLSQTSICNCFPLIPSFSPSPVQTELIGSKGMEMKKKKKIKHIQVWLAYSMIQDF